jgi:hypothetical protein
VGKDLVGKLQQDSNRTDLTVLFLRATGANFQAAFENDNIDGAAIGVVVRQTFMAPGGKPYHRYEAWQTVPWGYCEARLAVKVAILWLMRLPRATPYRASFQGIEVESNVLFSICDRGGLPAEALENAWLKRWEPRDYVEEGLGCKETSERPTDWSITATLRWTSCSRRSNLMPTS